MVFRPDVFELIQYLPQSEKVKEHPLVIVPPVINKCYVLDLAPGRSLAGEAAEPWLTAAPARPGNWWPQYAPWLACRSGGERDAPAAPGGRTLPPLDPAPGTYVFGA